MLDILASSLYDEIVEKQTTTSSKTMNATDTTLKLIRRNASKQIAKAFTNVTSVKRCMSSTGYQLEPCHELPNLQEIYENSAFYKLYQVADDEYYLQWKDSLERIYFSTNEVVVSSTEIEPDVIEQSLEVPQPKTIEASTKNTTKVEQFTGTVTEAKLVEATVYGIDYSAKERYAKALKVTLQAEDGRTVQFYSPSVQITISCPAGCPIAVVICEENDWIKKVQRQGEHKVVGENLESRLKIGDLVTVSGRIKVSYNNNKSVVINHIKLIGLASLAGQLPQKEYAYNSGDCIISYNAKDERIGITHKSNGFGALAGYKQLNEVLERGHSFLISQANIEIAKNDRTADPDSYWLNRFLADQETYALACWLDNRREKPVIKKKLTAMVN